MDLSPAITWAKPRYMISVPIVTMIEGNCSPITNRPLKAPRPTPAAKDSAMAIGIGVPA